MVLLCMKALVNILVSVQLTAALQSDAIWNIEVMVTIAIHKSPCSKFKNMNIVACAGNQNRSSMENALIFFY